MDMNNLPEDNPGSDANNLDGKQHNNNSNNVEEEEDLLATTQGQMRRARPQFINYAKKAKRVDVKKLKENIWKELGLDDLPIITRSEGEVSNDRFYLSGLGKYLIANMFFPFA